MTQGIVTGGWEFVWAAYCLTAAVLALYAVSVFTRLRAARRNAR